MRARALLLALCAASGCGGAPPPGAPAPPPWFRDEAAERGLAFEHRSGHAGERYLFPEIMGGGAALLDKEQDGDLDVYLVQGGSLEAAPGERPPNRLFENDGAGRFRDATEESGAGDRGYGMGAAVGDADGDGAPDLLVTNVGPNALLCNDGAGRFAARPIAGEPSWSTSAAFLDVERDGDLDLFVANYVQWSVADELRCSAVPHGADYCSPLAYDAPAPDFLLVNDGRGGFRDASAAAGLRAAFGNGLGVVCGDFDGDGWLDVFVANDGMTNQLWINRKDGTFADRAAAYGCAVDLDGRTKAGMGVDCVDLDDDGDEDLLVVNLHGETDSCYRNEGSFFSDRTPLLGLASASKPFTRFGCGFADFDDDGRLDLFVADGRVTKAAEPGPAGFFAEPNLLLRGSGTPGAPRFEEVLPRGGTAELLVETSRAAAIGDLDGDGALDVVVVNRDGPARLLRNVRAARGASLTLRVLERGGADALGALVTCRLGERALVRRVKSAYGYLTANDARVHLGLGEAPGVLDVRVRWLDGEEEAFGDLSAGAATLRRGQGHR